MTRHGWLDGPYFTSPGHALELATRDAVTPVAVYNAGAAVSVADELAGLGFAVRYAVKAGPVAGLIEALVRHGHGLDVASAAELMMGRRAGCPVDRMVASNPAMLEADLRRCLEHGVRLFVVDSATQGSRITRIARELEIDEPVGALVRLSVHDASAHYSLAEKFGIEESEALALAPTFGDDLSLRGVAYHLGSQASDPAAARAAARCALGLAERLGIDEPIVDVGGGFPAPYTGAERWRDLAEAQAEVLVGRATALCEPGRVIASAGSYLVASVVLVAERAGRRFVHLDAGGYHGLLEFSGLVAAPWRTTLATAQAAIPDAPAPALVVGPTCDGADALFGGPVDLPANLAEGDRVLVALAGAYAAEPAGSFNGIGPIDKRVEGH